MRARLLFRFSNAESKQHSYFRSKQVIDLVDQSRFLWDLTPSDGTKLIRIFQIPPNFRRPGISRWLAGTAACPT